MIVLGAALLGLLAVPVAMMQFLYRHRRVSARSAWVYSVVLCMVPLLAYAHLGAYPRLAILKQYTALEKHFKDALQQEAYEEAFVLLQEITKILHKDGG